MSPAHLARQYLLSGPACLAELGELVRLAQLAVPG